MATYNEVYKVTLPLVAGSVSVQGTTSTSDVFTYDSQTPSALAGTATSTYTQLVQNENGSLTYRIWDWATNIKAFYNLPALSSANAIEFINRVNSATSAFDGISAVKTAGDYSTSAEARMFIFGSAGNEDISAPTSKTSVTSIYGGAGNDNITGSASYSILDGGAGSNYLHGLSGFNYFRMYTGDGGTSTILADGGSDSRLQIYVNGTNQINSSQLWDLKRVGNDLEGFVKDLNGGGSTFTIKDQFTTNPVSYLNVYETGTSGAYLSAGLTDSATGIYQIYAGTDSADKIDLSNFKKARAYIFGNNGADTVIAKDGVTLRFYNDASDGIDSIVYGKKLSDYSIQSQVLASGTIATNVTPSGATVADYLSNVERLKFSDTSVALDKGVGQIGGEAYRLYKAAFDRTPDLDGLASWISALDNGMSLSAVATRFLNSDEFQNKNGGANPSNDTLVTLLYKNVLHRNPDNSGYTAWVNALESHDLTKEAVLIRFSESDENIKQTDPLIANGIQYHEWWL